MNITATIGVDWLKKIAIQRFCGLALRIEARGVDPVLKVGGRGINLYIHTCI